MGGGGGGGADVPQPYDWSSKIHLVWNTTLRPFEQLGLSAVVTKRNLQNKEGPTILYAENNGRPVGVNSHIAGSWLMYL